MKSDTYLTCNKHRLVYLESYTSSLSFFGGIVVVVDTIHVKNIKWSYRWRAGLPLGILKMPNVANDKTWSFHYVTLIYSLSVSTLLMHIYPTLMILMIVHPCHLTMLLPILRGGSHLEDARFWVYGNEERG